jgi:hypothetical protein
MFQEDKYNDTILTKTGGSKDTARIEQGYCKDNARRRGVK